MKTVVINNCRRLEICQLQPKERGPGGNVSGGLIKLAPGLNLVPSAEHAEAMKNPGWNAKFSTIIQGGKAPELQEWDTIGKPMLEIAKWVGEKGNGEVPDKAPLAKLNTEQCQRMITETFNSDLLKQWQGDETRTDVQHAISKQLERIKTGEIDTAASTGQ